MPTATQLFQSLQNPLAQNDGQLIIEVVDHGAGDGIDIRIQDPVTGSLCFEIVILTPEACPLINRTLQTSKILREFCRAMNRARNKSRICVIVEFYRGCHGEQASDEASEDRDVKVFRMAENLADEILTHRPGSMVELAMLDAEGAITSLM